MSELLNDLRLSLRWLRKNPGFSLAALATLALGIGANTAIFSVVNAVLLRPFPFGQPEQIVAVISRERLPDGGRMQVSPPDLVDMEEQNQVFEGMAAMQRFGSTLLGQGEPEELRGAAVSHRFFSVMGVQPKLGRPFTEAEDRDGSEPVVVLSDRLWHRRLASDPEVVGKQVSFNRILYTVVGVLPPGFDFPERAEFWMPLALNPAEFSRGARSVQVVARLREGVAAQQAQADLSAIASRLSKDYPDSNKDIDFKVTPLVDALVGPARPVMLVLLSAVSLVLLVACSNVASLLLARAARRDKEIAVRAALGAGRGQVLRQLFVESLVLALLGGAIGGGLAAWSSRYLARALPADIPRLDQIGFDSRVLVFTAAVSLLIGVLFGLVPALQASRLDLTGALKESVARLRGPGRGFRIREALVVLEVGLALLLTISAFLLIRSFAGLVNVDPGFSADNMLTVDVSLPRPRYTPPQALVFFPDLLQRVRALPGVESATLVKSRPFLQRSLWETSFVVQGFPEPEPGREPDARMNVVSEGFFDTMGISVLQGREFTVDDNFEGPPVALVNRALVERYFPGSDLVGKSLHHGLSFGPVPQTRQIVGVVADARQVGFDSEAVPELYVPHRQVPFLTMSLVAKTSVPPLTLAEPIRKMIWSIDPDIPLRDFSSMQSILDGTLSRPRFLIGAILVFAALALILTAIGLYGVISYLANQSRTEIGIRMALGAGGGDVLRLVIRRGLWLGGLGLLLGLFAAVVATRGLRSQLYHVQPTDPATYVAAGLFVAAVAFLASYLPARKAAKIDPSETLRYG